MQAIHTKLGILLWKAVIEKDLKMLDNKQVNIGFQCNVGYNAISTEDLWHER